MILTNLIDSLTTFSENHPQINQFKFGNFDEMDIEKENQENYPILYAVPSTVTIDKGQMEVDLDFIIAQPYFDGSKPKQLQQMLSVMGDLIAYSTQSTNQTGGLTNFLDTVLISEPPFVCEPFLVRFDNDLIGWSCTITFGCDYINNFCLVP